MPGLRHGSMNTEAHRLTIARTASGHDRKRSTNRMRKIPSRLGAAFTYAFIGAWTVVIAWVMYGSTVPSRGPGAYAVLLIGCALAAGIAWAAVSKYQMRYPRTINALILAGCFGGLLLTIVTAPRVGAVLFAAALYALAATTFYDRQRVRAVQMQLARINHPAGSKVGA